MSERGQHRGGRGGRGLSSHVHVSSFPSLLCSPSSFPLHQTSKANKQLREGEHRGRGGSRGDHSSGRGGGGHSSDRERPKKENILDLGKYMDKKICVKFTGGREVTGTLKGYDALMNLVLDDVDEVVRGLCSLWRDHRIGTRADGK
jgi:small nuclear ribonucleoprotein (snRNP)-like protein